MTPEEYADLEGLGMSKSMQFFFENNQQRHRHMFYIRFWTYVLIHFQNTTSSSEDKRLKAIVSFANHVAERTARGIFAQTGWDLKLFEKHSTYMMGEREYTNYRVEIEPKPVNPTPVKKRLICTFEYSDQKIDDSDIQAEVIKSLVLGLEFKADITKMKFDIEEIDD